MWMDGAVVAAQASSGAAMHGYITFRSHAQVRSGTTTRATLL